MTAEADDAIVRRYRRRLVVGIALLGLGAPFAVCAARAGTAPAGCSSGICINVDATTPIEAATGQASGLLHSIYADPAEESRLAGLGTTMWRSSWYGPDSNNVPRWSVVQGDHIPTTFVLSDKWWQDTHGGTVTPWLNWNAYRAWVVSSVQQMQAAGLQVDYWEVFNEPDQFKKDYYPPAQAVTVTPQLLLEQFLVTYQAIRSVLPAAQIIGPSLSKWVASSSLSTFSMAQFVDFASRNNLSLAALSWHYNGGAPQGIESEVTEARQLAAGHPSVGQPKIFINEFEPEQLQRIPGWDVQYLAAMISAKVDSAGRSCWANDCYTPVLDGLLASNGSSTLPDYWARVAYAQMSGTMVTASSTSDHAAALASIDAAQSAVQVLLGYGIGCTQDPRCASSMPWNVPRGPIPMHLTIRVPWSTGSVQVTAERISGTSVTPIGQPQPRAIGILPITAGPQGPVVEVNLGLINDGDAWSVLLAHAS